MRRPFAIVAGALALGWAPGVAESQGPALESGAPVRVLHRVERGNQRLVGSLLWTSDDSLVMTAYRARVALPRASIVELDVGRHSGTHALEGGLLGTLIGAVGGGVIAYLATGGCDGPFAGPCREPSYWQAGSGIGGATGLLVGIMVGRAMPRIIWQRQR